MTFTTVTTYTVTCDATLATACDATHPDTPHTCPAALTWPAGTHLANVAATLARAHWTTTPGKRLLMEPDHHYCPTHHPTALASTASTPSTPGGRTT